jgi:2-amino-4-hydroxy-6-hydroxymethyldihydropteridine diphosphokinase
MRMVISVGSNLEDPEGQVDRALDRLEQEFDLIAASSIYRTSPVGITDQPEFRNAVAIIEDARPPQEVLSILHLIEAEAGRRRDVRWGPRTLDLDLIVAGETVSDDPACLLPHPRAHERAFVLMPWVEIEPDAVIPGRGSVAALLEGAEGSVTQ